MFIVRLFRFIFGYVAFFGRKGFPERFLNLCAQKGIAVWDAKSSGGSLCAKTSCRSYRKIRSCASKSGMVLRITEKRGLPFILRPYKTRYGLLAGGAAAVILIALLTSCVWSVSVSGNVRFTDKQIISIAENYGIKPGVFKSSINLKEVRSAVKAQVDGISWFSVNIDGSRAFLEVSETEGSTEILDLSTPCNLVATADGQLVKLEVYTGEGAVSVGSAVVKGDLLISGVTEKSDGSASFVHARGTAVIRRQVTAQAQIPHTLQCRAVIGETRRRLIYLFGLELPLGIGLEGSCRREASMLLFRDVTLPVGIITEKALEAESLEKKLTGAQAELLAGYTIFSQEKILMENAETQKKTVEVIDKDDSFFVKITYINHEKTGIEQYFEVNEGIN